MVLATLIAKFEVERQDVLLIWIQIYFVLDVLWAKEVFGTTRATLKAVGTLPRTLWYLYELWLETLEMMGFVTDGTQDQKLPVARAVTLFTKDAIVAEPVILESLFRFLGTRQAVGMEALPTEITA